MTFILSTAITTRSWALCSHQRDIVSICAIGGSIWAIRCTGWWVDLIDTCGWKKWDCYFFILSKLMLVIQGEKEGKPKMPLHNGLQKSTNFRYFTIRQVDSRSRSDISDSQKLRFSVEKYKEIWNVMVLNLFHKLSFWVQILVIFDKPSLRFHLFDQLPRLGFYSRI